MRHLPFTAFGMLGGQEWFLLCILFLLLLSFTNRKPRIPPAPAVAIYLPGRRNFPFTTRNQPPTLPAK